MRRRKPRKHSRKTAGTDLIKEAALKISELPLDFLLHQMNLEDNPMVFRFRCAVECLPYVHRKLPLGIDDGKGGKVGEFSLRPDDLLSLPTEQLRQLLDKMNEVVEPAEAVLQTIRE